MNRARSSLDQKPPLAVSPRRLRPRRGLRSDAAAPRTPPAPSPKEAQQLRRSFATEESSPLVVEYEKISRELRALARTGQDDFANGDASETIAFATQIASGNSSNLFERGRLYEVYSARRNERLKRKMEETAEEVPARHSAAEAEVGKRKSTRRMDKLRKSEPESFLVGRAAPSLRSSLRSSSRETRASSVLRSAVRYNAEGERRSSVQSGRKN